MEDTQGKKKIKWRLNLFDVIFIVCAIVVAVLLLRFSGRSAGSVSVIPAGSQETVVYTVELQGMYNDSAKLVKPGDAFIDKVEKRALGTVVSVNLVPARTLQNDLVSGNRIVVEIPERTDAIVTVTAQATVTDSQITVDGYAIRVGTKVSIDGPLYNSGGFITDIVRER